MPCVRLIVLVLGVFMFGCGAQSGSYESIDDVPFEESGPKIKAPDFTVKDLDGKSVSLSDFKGKILFLDFWATWCPPCVISSPEVEKLHQEYNGKNVEVMSVSLDDSADAVKRYVAQKKYKNRMVMVGGSGIDVHYRVSAIPAFYVIDQKGYIAGYWAGYAPGNPTKWRQVINHLINAETVSH